MGGEKVPLFPGRRMGPGGREGLRRAIREGGSTSLPGREEERVADQK